LVPFWRLKKGLAVRAKPPVATPEATDIHPTQTENNKKPAEITLSGFSISAAKEDQKSSNRQTS
jgi:hypothetical protein